MDINMTVAYNLRLARKAQGLSLDALARESGVSKSMLGQIERGEVNPTVSVLHRVVKGLKIPFEQLLVEREEPICLMPDTQVTPVVEPGSTAMRYSTFPYDAKRGVEGYRLKLLPGFQQHWQLSVPGSMLYLTVFDGEVELELDGKITLLKQYDSVRFAGDLPCSCRNKGARTANLGVWQHYTLKSE